MEVQVKQVLLASAALLIGVSSAAFAATNADQGNTVAPAGTRPGSMADNGHQAANANLRQQLAGNLRQAGFSDVRIMPDSFLVQAKDQSGNPVTMFIDPTSVAMITREDGGGFHKTAATDTVNGQSTSGMNNTHAGSAGAMSGGEFATVSAQEDLSSKVVGLDIYNNANQDIGKIKDIAFDQNGIQAYIVAVGGFLGMGDHYVAVKPAAVNISYDANSKKWQAKMNTNADQLKAAPEYKYSSNE
jgi:sporulation protein YlmC with PRC-barrel domain